MTGELSPASVYVSLLPVVEACVVVAVPGRVGEVRVAADEPEAVDLLPRFYDYRNLITITTMGECNGNTRLVGSQGSTETYPSTTRTCITRLGYFPS